MTPFFLEEAMSARKNKFVKFILSLVKKKKFLLIFKFIMKVYEWKHSQVTKLFKYPSSNNKW